MISSFELFLFFLLKVLKTNEYGYHKHWLLNIFFERAPPLFKHFKKLLTLC